MVDSIELIFRGRHFGDARDCLAGWKFQKSLVRATDGANTIRLGVPSLYCIFS